MLSGCQWLNVPAMHTVVAVGWVNSKQTNTGGGAELVTGLGLEIFFIERELSGHLDFGWLMNIPLHPDSMTGKSV